MSNAKQNVQNLTEGPPLRLIVGFALPLLGGQLFQQFYSLADSMIVGRTLGEEALAGVGSTASILFMIIGFCQGVCVGFAIPVSQRFGAGDERAMRRFFANSIYLSAILALVMTAGTALAANAILTAMNTPANIYAHAYRYLLYIFLGIPTTFLFNLLSSMIQALGNTTAPVFFLVLASLINIVLDLVFILAFGMGTEGAAIATVLAQLASGLACAFYLWRRLPVLRLSRRELAPHAALCGRLLGMGLPMGLQYSITAIGTIAVQTAVNGLGSVAVASMTAAYRVHNVFCAPFNAIGATMATYAGQNVGAGRLDRLNQGLFSASLVGAAYSVAAFFVLAVSGTHLARLFLREPTPELLEGAHTYLLIVSVAYIPLLLVNAVRFTIQGMGYSGTAVLAGVAELFARTAAAVALVPLWGFAGACLAEPAAWLAADAFLIPAYFVLRRRTLRLFAAEKKAIQAGANR